MASVVAAGDTALRLCVWGRSPESSPWPGQERPLGGGRRGSGGKATWLPARSVSLVAMWGLSRESRESRGQGLKLRCVEEKVNSFLLSPSPKFLKCTHILCSNIEKSHSGCAYKKVVVKKLRFYDNVPAARERQERTRDSVSRWFCLGPVWGQGLLGT